MRDIDRELDAVEKAMAAEDVSVGPQIKSDLWRMFRGVVLWAVVAVVIFIVLRTFWH